MSERRYWLIKSEPEVFSFDDLWKAPRRTTGWDGVRNHQARNFMRDDMQVGDGVLFYHSNAEPPCIAGIAEVARAAYPDPTALDPAHDHFDAKSRADAPTWLQVDVRAVKRLKHVLTLPALRELPALAGMELLRRGSRLSMQPVRPAEWAAILEAGGIPR